MAGQGLDVRGLRKSYRNRPVIRDVSVSLQRGEVVALLGPNGSGKTTCFYCIAGLVSPDAGQVMIDGQNATHLPMFRRARRGPRRRSLPSAKAARRRASPILGPRGAAAAAAAVE